MILQSLYFSVLLKNVAHVGDEQNFLNIIFIDKNKFKNLVIERIGREMLDVKYTIYSSSNKNERKYYLLFTDEEESALSTNSIDMIDGLKDGLKNI